MNSQTVIALKSIFPHRNICFITLSPKMDFSGKVVIVTGSSAGIGEGIVILFAKLGAHVVVTGRNRDNVKRVADICLSVSPNKLKPLEVIADLTNDDEARNLIVSTIGEFGKIDVLVNNAGAVCLVKFSDENYMEVFDKVMRIDLRSVVYLSHLAVPHLEKTKGNIVNISSIAAKKPSSSQYSPYPMAKCALDMFINCLAIELGPKGIRVNGINSGAVKTNIFKPTGLSDELDEQLWEYYKHRSPLGILGKPENIANCAAFLASSAASFITGINMPVDGGRLCN